MAPELVPGMLTNCTICNEYLERRMTKVVEEIVVVQVRREDAFETLVRFTRGVHERHLSGLSLTTGTWSADWPMPTLAPDFSHPGGAL